MTLLGSKPLAPSRDNGCPACGGTYTSFNLQAAERGARPELAKLLRNLERVSPFKCGALYRCLKCQWPWFGPTEMGMIERLPAGTEELLRAWASQDLAPSQGDKAILREIGATEADLFGNGRGTFRFPCKVRLQSSKSFDPAILLVTKSPPIAEWQRPAFLYAEVAQLAPSAFSLPKEIRVATTRADEVRMGFAPTLVASSQGEPFVLNWSCDVFQNPAVSAAELRLCPDWTQSSGKPLDERSAIATEFTKPLAYVYCDWFADVEQYVLG